MRVISRNLARATDLPYTLCPAAARARLALMEPYDMEEPYMNPVPFRSDVIRMGSVIPKPSPPSMPPPPPPISQSYPSSLYSNKEVLSPISAEVKHNDNKSLERTDNAISNNECVEDKLISTQCGAEVISRDASLSPAMAPYMNVEICSKSSSILSTQGSLETIQFSKESNATNASEPMYMNVNLGQKANTKRQNGACFTGAHRQPPPPPPPPPPSTPILQSDEEEGSYVNLKTSEIESLRMRFPSVSVTSEISLLDSFASTGCPIKRVNYAILDLDKKNVPDGTDNTTTMTNCTLSPPESSNKPRKGYVTIDFKKTDALEIISQ